MSLANRLRGVRDWRFLVRVPTHGRTFAYSPQDLHRGRRYYFSESALVEADIWGLIYWLTIRREKTFARHPDLAGGLSGFAVVRDSVVIPT